MAYEGEGGSPNLSQARIYVKKALEKGETDAYFLYGRMLLKGEDGPADPIKARRYIEKALLSSQNNIQAQELYALMLMKGEGGPKELAEAQRYFNMGAERLQLGIKEGKVSMSQLKEYSDKGSVLAQEAYARMVMDTDLQEARHYCKMAVDQGYEPAKELLAIILKVLSGKK